MVDLREVEKVKSDLSDAARANAMQTHWVLTVFSILAGFSTIGSGYTQTLPRAGTEVVFNISEPIAGSPNFNWLTRGPKREVGAHQAMWEPLFLLDDRTGELRPWLGLEILPNAAQSVWTLKLRKDVFWSDSKPSDPKPFNANDVVFTGNLVINHDELPAAEAATFRSEVVSVEKVDDLTVTFTLRKPNPRFAVDNFGGAMFSTFLILPMHVWKDVKEPMAFKFEKPIGTGPYILKSIDDREVVWKRNEDWWGSRLDANNKPVFLPLPEPDELIWRYSPDATTSFSRIQNNEIDAGAEISVDEMAALKIANPKVIGWDPASGKGWNDPCPRQLEINTNHEHNAPWDDAKLRQALSLLIDRQGIADVAYEGSTVPSQTMFLENGAMRPFIDAVAAKFGLSKYAKVSAGQALIEAEGYTKGGDGIYEKGSAKLNLAIDVNEDLDQDTKSVQVMVDQLRNAGIAARAVPASTAELWGNVVPQGNYAAVYSWLSCGSVAEPWTSMSRYTKDKVAPFGSRSPGFDNTGRWDTAATVDYSKVVEEIGMMPLQIEQPTSGGKSTFVPNPDIPKRVVDAYKYLHDEMPFIPIVQSVKIIPFNTTYWTGWPTAADSYAAPMHSWSQTQMIIHHLRKTN
ncbi:ABC transporter substrate-binding protein [Mesorhizobium sp. M1423]|uniref:ABC transporter substrate-binding protein n=1 Tax=Mesorhizobium sp. M1423 TaxID=2957101 RepID=UPI00333BD23D